MDFSKYNYELSQDFECIKTVDMHTEGEPLRIIVDGFPEIKGNTILEMRNYCKENLDNYRTALMFEPKGHADMYGLIPVKPERDDSDFGVLFIHNEGYSTMCGHATLAITKFAVEMGWVKAIEPITTVKIDAPCGQLTSYAKVKNGEVESVEFDCVPSFVVALDEEIEVKELGKVRYDLAYGGAFYAYVNADQLDLELIPENYQKCIDYGMKIKHAVMDQKDNVIHPFEEDLSFLYGTIFISDSNKVDSRNVCVFAEGEVDRCPTGSGVSGRMAIHKERNELAFNEKMKIESILDTVFECSYHSEIEYGPFKAVIPRVKGNAYYTGKSEFVIDPNDPLKNGFIFR